MSENRLGALCSALVGLGWSIAIGINLFLWQPQFFEAGADLLIYEDAQKFLSFVAKNPISWGIFHFATTAASIALVPLIGLIGQYRKEDPRHAALHLTGVLGSFCGLIASLIDQFSTPILARWGAGNIPVALTMWEVIEPFRDNGLKTVTFLLLGLWLLWVAAVWQTPAVKRLYQLTRIFGWGLITLAVVEVIVPLPWRNSLGETGFLGFILLLLPVWAFWVANWFWQKELMTRGNTPL